MLKPRFIEQKYHELLKLRGVLPHTPVFYV